MAPCSYSAGKEYVAVGAIRFSCSIREQHCSTFTIVICRGGGRAAVLKHAERIAETHHQFSPTIMLPFYAFLSRSQDARTSPCAADAEFTSKFSYSNATFFLLLRVIRQRAARWT